MKIKIKKALKNNWISIWYLAGLILASLCADNAYFENYTLYKIGLGMMWGMTLFLVVSLILALFAYKKIN